MLRKRPCFRSFVYIYLVFQTAICCTNNCMAGELQIYVSTNGNDKNDGTEAKPLATLQRARDEVRKYVQKGLRDNIVVMLRSGEYRLNEPFKLGPEDSGTEVHSITYAAYVGSKWPVGRVIVSGGFSIDGFTKEKNNIWIAHIPPARNKSFFSQLYADGKRLTRGRWPKNSFLKLARVSKDFNEFEFNEPMPKVQWKNSHAELVVYEDWSICRGEIMDVLERGVRTKTPMGWVGHPFCVPRPEQLCYLEHALEFVNKPGEWFFDYNNGLLYYEAADGENPNDKKFSVPRLEQLVVMEGKRGNPVRNIHFRGIEFAFSGWNLPDEGYSEIQAAHYGTKYQTAPTYGPHLAIKLEHVQDSEFYLCRVHSIGASGLGMGAGCRANKITACEFDDIGGNGIMIGWREKADKFPEMWFENDWVDPCDAPRDNEIANCYVHRCGQVQFGGVGVFVAFSNGSRVVHNVVADLPYTGISVGFRWDTTETTQKKCEVAYNHIFNVMNRLTDGGGIYTLGLQSGTVLHNNLIHDVHRWELASGKAQNNGIFFDEGSKGYLIKNNIIFNTSGDAIRFSENQKGWHEWDNNYFYVSPADIYFPWQRAGESCIVPAYRDKILQN